MKLNTGLADRHGVKLNAWIFKFYFNSKSRSDTFPTTILINIILNIWNNVGMKLIIVAILCDND